MRFRFIAALTLVLMLVVAAAPSTASAASPCAKAHALPGKVSEGVLAKATVCLVNRERTRRKMRALRTNKRLSRAAVAHTRDMIDRHYFEHVAPSGQNVVDRLLSSGYLGNVSRWLVGENLAWGVGSHSSPQQIVVSWMKSPGHRRNMLNRRFREIGIGVVFSTPVRNAPTSATYTTTFGSRR